MLKTRASILAATIFSLSFTGATPADAAQGFLRCGGNNFVRGTNNTEVNTGSITFRNFNATQPITITRLVIYNAPGVIIFDSAVSGLPAFANGLLGPADNTLDAHQTSNVFYDSFLPFQAQNDRPLQTLIQWTSSVPVLPLGVTMQQVVRERDPVTGNHLAERSRTGINCEAILTP
jgi:hypothetical protein